MEYLVLVLGLVMSVTSILVAYVTVIKGKDKAMVKDYLSRRKYLVDSYWFTNKYCDWGFVNTAFKLIKIKRVNRNGIHYIDCANMNPGWVHMDVFKSYYKRVPPEDEGMVVLMVL
jgi:hypothetical protein